MILLIEKDILVPLVCFHSYNVFRTIIWDIVSVWKEVIYSEEEPMEIYNFPCPDILHKFYPHLEKDYLQNILLDVIYFV